MRFVFKMMKFSFGCVLLAVAFVVAAAAAPAYLLRCPSISGPKLLRLNVTVIGYMFVAYDMDT